MSKTFSLLTAGLIIVVPLADARAVDVVNDDSIAHVVVIAEPTGERQVRVDADSVARGACEACTIQLGEMAVDAEGSQMVTIKDGRLQIAE